MSEKPISLPRVSLWTPSGEHEPGAKPPTLTRALKRRAARAAAGKIIDQNLRHLSRKDRREAARRMTRSITRAVT